MLSLPVRFSLFAGLLVVGAVGLATVTAYRTSVGHARAQTEALGHTLISALAVSHSGHVLQQKPDHLLELRRVAQRLVHEDERGLGIVAASIYDDGGRVLARAGAPDPGAGLAAGLPATVVAQDAGPGLRRLVGPVTFGDKPVGAVELLLRDDFAIRLRPELTAGYLRSGGIAALLGALLLFLLARASLRPVPALAAAIERVRQGDFGYRLPRFGDDELGRLAHAFNDMSQRLALFGQYTNPAVIQALIRDPELAGPGGVMRHVTVVFCDMRGFTRTSARQAPSAVLRLVNLYFHLLERVVLDHGGHIDKFMGDAMMALFGVFDPPPDDLADRLARNGVVPYSRSAVVAMTRARDAMKVLAGFLEQAATVTGFPAELSPQRFGFGIASGHATVGNIGGSRKKDYSVVGNIVNLAARLESQSTAGEVLIDSHTWRNLGGDAVVRPRPPVELKGFDKPVTPFEVVRLSEDAAAAHRETVAYLAGVLDRTFLTEAVLQRDPLFTRETVDALAQRLEAALAAFSAAGEPRPPAAARGST